jgi:hypothetical protein
VEVSSSNLKFRLSLVEIEELKPHEEVIEADAARLAEKIARDSIVKDPLMVDQDDHVILDGMHRFKSLKTLGCRFAPCCLLDYMSPLITVGSWFRLFKVDQPESVANSVLSNMNIGYKLHNENGEEDTSDALILLGDGHRFDLRNSTDIPNRCRLAVSVEKRMVNEQHPVTYLSERIAIEQLKSGEANFVIVIPSFTKETIRHFGLQGLLLPHKVTRHVIPSRPLSLNVPLSLLRDASLSRRQADEKLGELLAARKVDRKPPGSIVDGRRYDEELLIFSQ